MVRTSISAACATLVLQTPLQAQHLHEEILPGVVRSFTDSGALVNAEASVALISDTVARGEALGAAPDGFAPLPVFFDAPGLSTVVVPVEPGVSLYGTGFVSGPLERTGRRIENYNLDNFGWGDFSNRNYQTHPWIIGLRPDGSAFGVLFDSTWRSAVDTTQPQTQGIIFQTEGPPPRVLTINADSPQQVVERLAELTGDPFMPPMWSIGYHQSRFSYTPQSVALATAQEFRTRQIPADVIWMDIDYMDGFRNFTFNPLTYPNPALLNAQLDTIGFSGVWMANCGIKVDSFYDVDNELVAIDGAVKRSDGTADYIGEVWPGQSRWPDFTMQTTRAWWAGRIAGLAALGADGVWNDMNEPAVFNVASKTMPDNNIHRADPDLGGTGNHVRYHNIYGMQMSRATYQGMLQERPDLRPFVLTRAGYMGGHRYAAMWTGDNVANWYHVDVSVQNVLNIGLSGQPNCGPDIGGFNGDGGGDQYARWMGIGAMMPFARGHYGFQSGGREPWSYNTDTTDTCRLALNRRYRLLNYFYTCFYEAHTTGLPVCRPLFFAEPANPALREWDEGFLVGPGLLVVGATMPGAVPQLPPMQTPVFGFDFPQSDDLGAPRDSLDPDLPDLYVLGGHIVVANPLVQSSRALSSTRDEELELIIAVNEEGSASGTFFEDDGETFASLENDRSLVTFEATMTDNQVTVGVASAEGTPISPDRPIRIRFLWGDRLEITLATTYADLPVSFGAPTPQPAQQPDPTLVDGRLITEAFAGEVLATNQRYRFSEMSQLRAISARADRDELRIGLEGELAIDGTAIALFIDSREGGQSTVNTNGLNPPPAGLAALSGTAFDEGFRPDHMLFANGFDGSVFCDWVTLNTGAPATKQYIGRQFIGSGSGVLVEGNNSVGLNIALGSGGHRIGSGFEIVIPFSALGEGLGPTREIRLFAAIVKGDGAITTMSLPQTTDIWPGVDPDFSQIPGRQYVTIVRADDADVDRNGSVEVEDLYAQSRTPRDVTGDGTVNDDDARALQTRVRAGEARDMTTR